MEGMIERGSVAAPREKKKKTRERWLERWVFSVDREVQGAATPLESKNMCNHTLEENQNHCFWRFKVQPHHWKARTGEAAPLRRSKILSSRGARYSRTREEFFWNSYTDGGRKGRPTPLRELLEQSHPWGAFSISCAIKRTSGTAASLRNLSASVTPLRELLEQSHPWGTFRINHTIGSTSGTPASLRDEKTTSSTHPTCSNSFTAG